MSAAPASAAESVLVEVNQPYQTLSLCSSDKGLGGTRWRKSDGNAVL